ncbi:MAG: ADP-ribosylation factor-like protein [archaeon]|nr:ADP-ribosylation factor-like protein [archaeon]
MSKKNKNFNCIKVAVLGCTNTGKTAVINRLINKTFIKAYNPTLDIETYSCLFNLNDDDVEQKTFVHLIVQDTFGLNNSILNKPPELITSKNILAKREKMSQQFKDIMFSSSELRNKIMLGDKGKKDVNNMEEEILLDNLGYESEVIPRLGFVFVCDCEKLNTFDSVEKVIEKLQEIEKSNNLKYPKLILFNKSDKVDEEEFKEYIHKKQAALETFSGKYRMDILRVSALTGNGIVEAFKSFLTKIHQEQQNKKQNEGINEPEGDEDEKDIAITCNDKLASFSKKAFCGRNLFSCGVRIN